MHIRHGVIPGLLLATAVVKATVLYDGSSNGTPSQAPYSWLYLAQPLFGGSASQTAGGGYTTLDSTPVTTDKAGYFGVGLATLDRTVGYTVSLTLRLASENHLSQDRAGFSLIALSSDKQGIELGFWSDQVWAQNVGFTHGESANFSTTAAQVRFDCVITGDTYSLLTDGVPLLSGSLRDYSAFGSPYDVADFLFLGDDTSSAAAKLELARVEVSPAPPGKVTISNLNGEYSIGWTAGVLTESTTPDGNYVEVPNATSPYTIPASTVQKFYRTKTR